MHALDVKNVKVNGLLEVLFRTVHSLKECVEESESEALNDDIYATILYSDASPPAAHIENEISKDTTPKTALTEETKEMPKQYTDGSFSVRKNGSLKYRFKFAGDWVWKYGWSKQECFNRRAEHERKFSLVTAPKAQNCPTVGEYAELYYKTYKVKKDGKKVNPDNERYIRKIKDSALGRTLITKAKDSDCQTFLKDYDDKPNTKNKIATFINAFLDKAVKNRVIKSNSFDRDEIARHEPEHYNVIQPREQNLLLQSIDNDKYHALFWYLCCSGLRLDNALDALKYIDMDNLVIAPNKKDAGTKKHRVRVPYLAELLTPSRLALLKEITYNGAQCYFKNLFKKLDLSLVIHSCRKVFASCAYHAGFSDKWIQSCLGHKTLKMTQDTYVELLDNEDSPILDYFRRLKAKLYPN